MKRFSRRTLALAHRLSRAIDDLKARGLLIEDNLLEHLSPLGWENINLTGDYIWRQNRRVESGKFRPPLIWKLTC